MSMSKKDFIALADVVRRMDASAGNKKIDIGTVTGFLADFCQGQNCNFKRDRWMDYIAGKCGPNGGKVKPC
jgi:hypothetical protein